MRKYPAGRRQTRKRSKESRTAATKSGFICPLSFAYSKKTELLKCGDWCERRRKVQDCGVETGTSDCGAGNRHGSCRRTDPGKMGGADPGGSVCQDNGREDRGSGAARGSGAGGSGAGAGHAEQPPEEKKKIALTFDDGPHPIYTERLLDGLAERGVKAAFFLLGCNIEGNEEIVRRMAEEGHLVGNHTFYHVDITTLPQEEACAEIQDTSRKIMEITGEPVEYVRPPFGNWNKELECELMMIPVFWTLDTLDWSTRNTDLLVEQVVSEAEENDIILMHDSYDSTVKAALRIIDLLQAEGFEFVRADELILE